MQYKVIEVLVKVESLEKMEKFRVKSEIIKSWKDNLLEDNIKYSLLVNTRNIEMVMDGLIRLLNIERDSDDISELDNFISIISFDAFLPSIPSDKEKIVHYKKTINRSSTDEIFEKISGGLQITQNFLLNIFLSTIVCSIAIIKNDTSTFIAAAAISPVLGPILNYSFALALADTNKIKTAMRTMLYGYLFAIFVGLVIGTFFTESKNTLFYINAIKLQFSSMTYNFYTIVLAVASGFSSGLSIITGSSTMLASFTLSISLIPALVLTGLLLANDFYLMAFDSFLMAVINIFCIIFSSQIIFKLKKIVPKTRNSYYKKNVILSFNILLFVAVILVYLKYKSFI